MKEPVRLENPGRRRAKPHDVRIIDTIVMLQQQGWVRKDLVAAEVGCTVLLPVTISVFDASNLHEFMETFPTDALVGETDTRTQKKQGRKQVEQIISRALFRRSTKSYLWAFRSVAGLRMHNCGGQSRPDWIRNAVSGFGAWARSLSTGSMAHFWHLSMQCLDPPDCDYPSLNEPTLVFATMADQIQEFLGRGTDEFGITSLGSVSIPSKSWVSQSGRYRKKGNAEPNGARATRELANWSRLWTVM